MRHAFNALSLCLLCLTTGANARKSSAPLNLHPAHGNPPDAHTVRLHERLLVAAATSDIPGVKALLAQGADINVIENYSKTHTPLTYAAESGDVAMTRFLLAHGADPNGMGVYLSPLYWTISNGQTECVRLLLRAGANPRQRCVDSARPIDFAAGAGYLDIVNMLIGRMPELTRKQIHNYRREAANVLLNNVVTRGRLRDIRYVVAAGAQVNYRDGNDADGIGLPLMRAAKRGSLPIIRFLIQHGAKVNSRDGSGRTALMYVGKANLYYSELNPTLAEEDDDSHRETTRILLRNGASVEVRDKSGMTPLMFAAMGSPQAMELMLMRGAKITDRDVNKSTALHWAALWRDPKSLEILLRHGASVNARNADGATPLMLASVHTEHVNKRTTRARLECLKVLLRYGANPHLKDRHGRTAFHYSRTSDGDYINGC